MKVYVTIITKILNTFLHFNVISKVIYNVLKYAALITLIPDDGISCHGDHPVLLPCLTLSQLGLRMTISTHITQSLHRHGPLL